MIKRANMETERVNTRPKGGERAAEHGAMRDVPFAAMQEVGCEAGAEAGRKGGSENRRERVTAGARRRLRRGLLPLLGLSLALTACGGGSPAENGTGKGGAGEPGGTAQPPAEAKPDPITLRFYNSSNMNLESFQKSYIDPIQTKYPHITVEVVKNEKGATIEELTALGNVPDVIMGGGANFAYTLNDLKIVEDLTPYVQKYKYDLTQITPNVLDTIKAFFNSDKLPALPAGQLDFMLIYYNKDIFDKFGAPYPTNGMTWDELYDLAKRVTRTDNGVAYRGLDFQDNSMIQYNPLSLPYVDSVTQLASVNNDGWKRWFTNMKRFHEIPGNLKAESLSGVGPKLDDFIKDRTLAMLICMPILSRMPDAEKQGFNWDIASMPSYPEQPGAGLQLTSPYFAISSTSKHKDQAFQALTAILEKEPLTNRVKDGIITILSDPQVNAQFGVNSPTLAGKNVAAITSYKTAKAQPYYSAYDSVVINELINGFRNMVKQGTDVNTALRSIEEQANKKIEAMKQQAGK